MKSIFTKIRQVAIVTRNTRESVKRFADLLGVGPWSFYDFNPTNCKDMTISSKRVDYAMALAICDIGKIQFEFCQPLDNKSLYAKFLSSQGEGLQHIAYALDREYDDAVKYFKVKGITINQSGDWHGCCNFNYLDSFKQLKHTAEFHRQDLDEVAKYQPNGVYPAGDLDLRSKPILTDLIQVGLVVKNLDATIKTYTDEFNVGPWKIREYNNKNVKDMKIYGEPVDCSYRVATTKIGETEMELIQPNDKKSIFAEFSRLSFMGEGFHHLTYKVDNFEKTKARFRDIGVSIAQSGIIEGQEFIYYNSLNEFKHIIKIHD